ncbi:MAG TPA: S8 family serine peptidase [Actinocrinis sp.]|nr:S8 family serine peptidase [Actinocrinis sp.]
MVTSGDIEARRRALRRGVLTVVAVGVAVCNVLGVAEAAQAADIAAASPATRAQQWYLNRFDMNTAWKTTRGGGVTVAIVGSGVDVGQADISGASQPQIDFSTGTPKPAQGDVSSSNDGTAAAILVAGSGLDSSGIQGIAPKAKVLPLRYYANDKATATPTPAYAALAIRYAADHGARVILMPSPAPYDTASLSDAVQYALGKNAVVVTSASNNGRTSNQMTAPCTIRGTICVSGTTRDGTVWPDSSTGPAITLGAPAQDLPVWSQDKYGIHSSTHYSAALVAGEAALVFSAHPTWTAGQVISVMIDTATGGNAAHTTVNDKVGYGVMNPVGALAAPQPTSTANPLVPAATPTAGAPTAAPSPRTSAGTGGQAASSPASSGSSLPWLLIGVGAAVVILGGALVVMLLMRSRSGGGRNYLSDPGYQAGQYYHDGGGYGSGTGWSQAEPGNPPDNFSRPLPGPQQPGYTPGYTSVPDSWLQPPPDAADQEATPQQPDDDEG